MNVLLSTHTLTTRRARAARQAAPRQVVTGPSAAIAAAGKHAGHGRRRQVSTIDTPRPRSSGAILRIRFFAF